MEIIKLNLIPNGVNPVCHCSQYDAGRVVRAELFDGLTPYIIDSGDTFTLLVKRPDNVLITAELTATQGDNYIDLVTTEQMTARFGESLCELKIENNSRTIGSINFYMLIEKGVDGAPAPAPSRQGGLNSTQFGITSSTYTTE